MKWFFIDESITEGDRRQGPFSIDEIREFVNSEKITGETLIWHSGMESWVHWNETEESRQMDMDQEELLKNTIQALLDERRAVKRFAGFGLRAGAFLIDNIILGVVGAIVFYILGSTGIVDLAAAQELMNAYVEDPTNAEALEKLMGGEGMGPFVSFYTIVQTAYFVIFHAILSATPGKLIFHIHVETQQGERLTWGGSIARYLCSVLTQFTTVFYGIGYLIVCLDPKRRALHDWIARTFVVCDRKEK